MQPARAGLVPGDRHENSLEKGRTAARLQAWRNLYNALTLCQFENPPTPLLVAALNAATGWDLAAHDLVTTGKRIVNIKRLLNMKLGLTKIPLTRANLDDCFAPLSLDRSMFVYTPDGGSPRALHSRTYFSSRAVREGRSRFV